MLLQVHCFIHIAIFCLRDERIHNDTCIFLKGRILGYRLVVETIGYNNVNFIYRYNRHKISFRSQKSIWRLKYIRIYSIKLIVVIRWTTEFISQMFFHFYLRIEYQRNLNFIDTFCIQNTLTNTHINTYTH